MGVIGEDSVGWRKLRFEGVEGVYDGVLGVEEVELVERSGAVAVVKEGEAGGECIAMIARWRSRVKWVLWNIVKL
jgi:hypothetical protein